MNRKSTPWRPNLPRYLPIYVLCIAIHFKLTIKWTLFLGIEQKQNMHII